jgi:hypothetical protein
MEVLRKAICMLVVVLLTGSLNAAWVVDTDFESGLDGWTTFGNVNIVDADGSKVLRPVSYGTDLWEVKKGFVKQTDTNTTVSFDYKVDNVDNGSVDIAICQGEWPWKYVVDVSLTKTAMTIGGVTYTVDSSDWQAFGLTFDYSAKTFDVLLGDKGDQVSQMSVLADDVAMNTGNSVSSIAEIRIREEPADTRSTFYLDNVKIGIIPEPATVTLLGLGSVVSLLRKNRK